jgi:cytidylate kinase
MIVTIDGPAAAGKSTVAKALANRLGFDFLDTGAMYRAVTLAALRRGVPLDDEAALGELAASLHITLEGTTVLLDGEDVTAAIRTPDVTRSVRHVADAAPVRQCMVRLQREAAAGRDIVTEGRDQGTVVFPDAACKFFLSASAEVRAARRQKELADRGANVTLEQVLADQADRDRRDAARAIAPMVPAPDAIPIDSSQFEIAETVAELERIVRLKLAD